MDIPSSQAERNLNGDKNLSEPSKVRVMDPLFFQLKFDNKVSYILGTTHALPLSVLPKPVKKLIETIKTLALETSGVDIGADIDIDAETIEQELFFEGILLEPKELDYFSMLPISMRERLEKLLSRMSIKTGNHNVKINFLCLLLENERMILAGNGMDGDLETVFKNQNTEILELDELSINEEPFEEEYRNLDPSDTYARLYYWEENDPVWKSAGEQLAQRYCRGDIESLMTDANCEAERNLSWIPKIMYAHRCKPSPCLFAFGAGHLIGAYGILNILQQSGVEIFKIDNQGRFFPFTYKSELSVSASQVETQKQNYESFRHQILEPTNPSVSWLYTRHIPILGVK